MIAKEYTFGEGKTYPILINSNALFKLEERTGLSTERIGMMMVTGRAGYQLLQIILWAGLEAGRVRYKLKRPPFEMEEVGDLLDLAGGAPTVWLPADDGMDEVEEDGVKVKKQVRTPRADHPLAKIIHDCWVSAFPKPREEDKANPPQASVAEIQPGTTS